MISEEQIDNLIRLANAGASLKVDGANYQAENIIRVTRAIRPGAFLEVCISDEKQIDNLLRIAQAGKPGGVIFS